MSTFCDVLHETKQKRKQTLENSQYGLEIILTECFKTVNFGQSTGTSRLETALQSTVTCYRTLKLASTKAAGDPVNQLQP